MAGSSRMFENVTINRIRQHLAKQIRSWRFDERASSDSATFHVSQGDACNARRAWPEAIEHYKKALAISPNLTPIWIQLGHGLRETNQFEQAEHAYQRALEVEPDNEDAKFFLGVTRSELNKDEEEEEEEEGKEQTSSAVPGEAPWEAPEPPEFRFYPRDIASSWVRPEEYSGQDGMSVFRLSGQALGLLPSDAVRADAIAHSTGAFHAISRPRLADNLVSRDAARYTSFQTLGSGFSRDAGLGLADIWFVNSRTLRVRFKPDNAVQGPFAVLRCFQYDPDDLQRLLLLTEQPLATDIPTFVDVAAANPYFPLAFVVCTENAEIVSLAVLPFPSLCRGGLHFAELLSAGGTKPYLQALEEVSSSLLLAALKRDGRPAVERIEIDLDAATGTERIFEKSLQFWLSEVLGSSIGTGAAPEEMDAAVLAYLTAAVTFDAVAPAAHVDRKVLLRLPADAVPSLHSLMVDWNAAGGVHAAPFALASAGDGAPRYLLSPPSTPSGADDKPQYVRTFPVFEVRGAPDEPHGGIDATAPPIAAIRFRRLVNLDEAQLLAPFPLDIRMPPERLVSKRIAAPFVSVIHHFSGEEKVLAAVLEALSLQQDGDALQVLIAGSESDADRVRLLLHRFFPSRGHFIDCPEEEYEGARLNRAAAQAEAEFLLVLGDAVLLHDPSAVSALSSLMKAPGVASATCILTGPQNSNKTTKLGPVSSGYFPVVGPTGEVSIEIGEILLNLPRAVWPATVNSSRLFMVGKEEWRRIGGFADQRLPLEELGTPFWATSIAEGRSHMVTTAISASLLPVAESVVSRYRAASQFLPPAADASRLSLTIRRLVA